MQGLRGGRRFSAIVNDFGTARLWTNAVRQGLMVASPVGGALGVHRAEYNAPFPRWSQGTFEAAV